MSSLREFWQRTQSIRASLLVLCVFLVGFLLGTQYNVSSASQIDLDATEEEEFQAFWQAYDLLRSRYLDPLDTHALVEGAISGMMDAAGDQYTGYMPSDVYSLLDEDISGEIQGIGVVIRTLEETGRIEVANVMRDTPAERAGVQVGDVFLEVDGEDVTEFGQLELAGVVRGPRGSTVDIVFLRDGEPVEYEIERDRIPVPTSEYGILEGDVAYLRLYEFNPQSRPQFDEALVEMNVNERAGLVIDLRGNPGGTLDGAIDMTSAFIEEGTILREEFANRTETLEANGDFADVNVPVVVLVDETSASASELMAGAMQDTDTGTVIGETTFGKGTVQIWQGLSNGGGVRITIARWLTPDGSWIHEQGIAPDYVVNWDPENGYLLDIEDPESVDGDPQLQSALEFLQAGELNVDEIASEFNLTPESEDDETSVTVE